MKALKLLLIISLLIVPAESAQETFSDSGVRYEGMEDTFFPNLKGTFEKTIAATSDLESIGYDRKAEAMLVANLNRILSVFEGCPLLNPPRGLQVKATAFPSIKKPFAGKAARLEAVIEVDVYASVADEKGNPGKLPEAADSLSIYINNPTMLVGAPVLEDIYIQPARTADFYGYPVNETGRGEVNVLTKIKQPLYIPVSQADFIKASIRHWQQKMAESASEGAEAGANRSSRKEFEMTRAQRRKDFQAAYAAVKKADPSAAEELKKAFEQTEKELEQEMAGNNDYDVSKRDVLTEADKIHAQKIRDLQAELAALSAKEKSDPAYYSSSQMEANASGLVSPGHPGAEALIRINSALFNALRPQSDIQLIILDWHDSHARTYAGDKKGFDLQKWFLSEIYKRDDVWRPIIQMLSN